jgi:Fur family iron response transcriptional regulator
MNAGSSPPATGDRAQRLRACGITPTPQRLQIAALVLDRAHHMTAEQVLAALRSSGSRVSKATVYNTLNLFASRGLVHHLALDSSGWFDSNTSPHFHFQDVDTGRLTDIAMPDVSFERLPALPEGMEVAGIDLVIRVRRRRA